MSRMRPLKARDIVRVLRKLGFHEIPVALAPKKTKKERKKGKGKRSPD
ncbi:MAG: hypothetical protein QOI63_1518 [Thermoplasmata archaeon]|jgi:hypothetical protein|nr:hypothetical protein [Thermoplasmata archaeon]